MHDFAEREDARSHGDGDIAGAVRDGLRALSGAELRIEARQDSAAEADHHAERHEHRQAPGWISECQDACAAAAEIVAAHRARAASSSSGASVFRPFPDDGGDNLVRYGRYWLPSTAVTAAADGGLLLGGGVPIVSVVLIQSLIVLVVLAPAGLRSLGEVAGAVAEGSPRRFWNRLAASILVFLLAVGLISLPGVIVLLSGGSPEAAINWYNVRGEAFRMFGGAADMILSAIERFWTLGGWALSAMAWLGSLFRREKAPAPIY